jgi:hypothetical protein
VTAGYFGALGIPILRGRGFDPSDRAGTVPVAVVDRALAERYWPGGDPVGRMLTVAGGSFEGRLFRVVGVAGDVEEPGREPGETAYAAMAQTSIDSTVWDIVQPGLGVQTAAAALGEALTQRRTATVLALVFGACGLLLAAVGTYGIVAYTVSRSVRDFGVRMALGASRGSVLRSVLRRAGRWIATGVGLGLIAAAGLSPFFAGSLQAVAPTAPGPYAAAAGLLLSIGLAACLEPALRATRTDPAETLREG